MSFDIFKPGGPHNIKKIGANQHEIEVSLPADRDGRVARSCPNSHCSPGEFKVKPGTGITESQDMAYCPYCRSTDSPAAFTTPEQIRYAKDIAIAEAQQGIQNAFAKAFGLNSQGKRTLAKGGLINMSIEMKRSPKPHVRRPYADVLKRDVVCPSCGLDHSVYGLATYCFDCGNDIFTTHVRGEILMIEKALADVPRRESDLGERIAAKDVENALEDLVSVFEAVLKREIRQYLASTGLSNEDINARFKKIGSRLQSIRNARQILSEDFGIQLNFSKEEQFVQLDGLFQKRHPITHNLGVIDRAYLNRIKSADREGREVHVSAIEVENACKEVFDVLEEFHIQLFPNALKAES